MYRLLAIMAMGLFVAACDNDDEPGYACTTVAVPAVSLRVYDGNTENELCGVTGMLMDGEYIEDIVIPDSAECLDWSRGFALERDGNYQIVLEKEGYKTWTSEEIKVTRDSCHVRTVNVKANMEKI